MNKRTIIWRVLPAVSLAFGCGSKTVVDTSTSSGAGGEGASTSAGSGGAGPFSCGDDSDCSPEDACRFKISETCDGAAPQCVSKTKNSLCEDGQEWDDPGPTSACLCKDGIATQNTVYLECGTRAYPAPIWFGPGCLPP